MAVFTPVSLSELQDWMSNFPQLGNALAIRGISSGIENSNFFIDTGQGEYVLTIFENLSFDQLPFYVHLLHHLSERDILVPAPVLNKDGHIITALHDKPACIVSKLEGQSQMQPQAIHCAEAGAMLAKMHLAARDYRLQQPNLRDLDWIQSCVPALLPHLDADKQHLLTSEVHGQQAFRASGIWPQLPRGVIHADLFRNNVMFVGDKLSGFFDFYFAGVDTWLFDVAVTINDWCIDLDSGVLDEQRVRAMLDAYQAVRAFTPHEEQAWPMLLRAAALRFWVSRLYDFYLPRAAQMLTPHDPGHFERILRARITLPIPPLRKQV